MISKKLIGRGVLKKARGHYAWWIANKLSPLRSRLHAYDAEVAGKPEPRGCEKACKSPEVFVRIEVVRSRPCVQGCGLRTFFSFLGAFLPTGNLVATDTLGLG